MRLGGIQVMIVLAQTALLQRVIQLETQLEEIVVFHTAVIQHGSWTG